MRSYAVLRNWIDKLFRASRCSDNKGEEVIEFMLFCGLVFYMINLYERATVDKVEKAARTICAHEYGGFCDNVGKEIGCKVGRGESPHWSKCVATSVQLALSGRIRTAEEVIKSMEEE